eukprot:1159533-Pelagomonas_calceolata.AAC.3
MEKKTVQAFAYGSGQPHMVQLRADTHNRWNQKEGLNIILALSCKERVKEFQLACFYRPCYSQASAFSCHPQLTNTVHRAQPPLTFMQCLKKANVKQDGTASVKASPKEYGKIV